MSDGLYEKIKNTAKNSVVEVVLNAKMHVTEMKDYFALQEKFSNFGMALSNVCGYFKECAEDLVIRVSAGCGTGARPIDLHIPLNAIKDYKVQGAG